MTCTSDREQELLEQIEGWKRVAVIAVIPLEAMRMSGGDELLSAAMRVGIDDGIAVVRAALSDGTLPSKDRPWPPLPDDLPPLPPTSFFQTILARLGI